MMKWLLVMCLFLCPGALNAQTSTVPQPAFEVTSVKQHVSQQDASDISTAAPGRFTATNVPLRFLILYAFQLMDHQLVGTPDWTLDKAYDVVGIYPTSSKPGNAEIRLMLQGLLAERFGLVMHREKRDLPAYDLVLSRPDGRPGSQMHRSDSDCIDAKTDTAPPTDDHPSCRVIATRTHLTGQARTMPQLAGVLQSMLARPVVDRTGLDGRYDIELRWASMTLQTDAAASDSRSEGASLFTALQEQAGLKLVAHKERFDVSVVDRIQPPTPN